MDDVIKHRYESGATTVEIAKELGRSTEWVRLQLVRMGIQRRTKYSIHPDFEAMFRANTPREKIAAHLCVSLKVVNRWVRELGLTRSHGDMISAGRTIEIPPADTLEDMYRVQRLSLSKIARHFDVARGTVSGWMKTHGIPITVHETVRRRASTKRVKYGYEFFPPEIKTSQGEKELIDFLNSIGGTFEADRTILSEGMELDGFDQNLMMAVEYCGLYWHSEERGKTRLYHAEKHKQCARRGIRLFTIYEDEWRSRQDIVKSFLSAQIGRFEKRIGARQTTIVEVSDWGVLSDWHIQGVPRMVHHAYGLQHEEELVGLVTFAPHHRQNDELTLNRLAFKPGVQVIGGASRLVQQALKRLDRPVITWSDNRWSTGEVYRKIGFTFDGDLPPDYSYTDGNKRRTKQSCKKSLIGCPANITEREFLAQQGWFRIWDCGKRRWKWAPK